MFEFQIQRLLDICLKKKKSNKEEIQITKSHMKTKTEKKEHTMIKSTSMKNEIIILEHTNTKKRRDMGEMKIGTSSVLEKIYQKMNMS